MYLLVLAAAMAVQGMPAAFEAASVKPAQRMTPSLRIAGGQVTGIATMKTLLRWAYDLRPYQISGPAWIDTERYEIAAKLPEGATKEQVPAMLQALLAERFGLVVHRETKELPVYALVVAKGGAKLKSSAAGEDGAGAPKLVRGANGYPEIAPGSEVPRTYQVVLGGPDGLLYKLWARRETMQQLADRLSSQLARAVVDRTGLAGGYDFSLSWTIEAAGGVVPRTEPPPDEIEMYPSPVLKDPGLSLFTAVQGQLGLKLEAGKGPVETLVIDKVERVPTGN
jgi:uncharacterized protein (TIGR03435 family)